MYHEQRRYHQRNLIRMLQLAPYLEQRLEIKIASLNDIHEHNSDEQEY